MNNIWIIGNEENSSLSKDYLYKIMLLVQTTGFRVSFCRRESGHEIRNIKSKK